MMTSKIFYAVLAIELMKIGFKGGTSHNKCMYHLVNSKHNSVYVTLDPDEDSVNINVYKQTASALQQKFHVFNEGAITELIDKIILKLKLNPKTDMY